MRACAGKLFLSPPAQFGKDVPELTEADVRLMQDRISAILDVLPSRERFLDELSKR